MYNNGGKKYLKIELGDIFYAVLSPSIGSEQSGFRPVLIIQNNKGNKYSPTTIVVPITSKVEKKDLPTHVRLKTTKGLKKESIALVEQIRTLDKKRIFSKITEISKDDLENVKNAIKENLSIRSNNLFDWK